MVDADTLKIIVQEENDDLDSIPFSDFHDNLCERGLKIGFKEALLEYNRKGWLTDERIEQLKETLFYDSLHNELKKKHVFHRIDINNIFEEENENESD